MEKKLQNPKKREIITKSEMMAIKDSVTNEMVTAKVTMIVQRDKPKFKGEPFTLLFQAVNKAISRNITPATAKLLLYVCSEVNYANVIGKGVPQMAEELGYSERQVHRAMKELEALKVIIKSKNVQDGRITMYHLNPLQSWKGAVPERAKKIATYDPSQLDIFGELPTDPKAIKALQPNTGFYDNADA